LHKKLLRQMDGSPESEKCDEQSVAITFTLVITFVETSNPRRN